MVGAVEILHAQEVYYNWEADPTGTRYLNHNLELKTVDYSIFFNAYC